MFAKTKTIPDPESDPELRELRKQQEKAHAEIAKNSPIVENFLQGKAAAESLLGNLAPHRAPGPEQEARAKEASAKVRAARAVLRDLEMPLRDARRRACDRIVAQLTPDYLAQVGAYARAYLATRADEIAALDQVLAMRAELDSKQISMTRLPVPPFERNLGALEWSAQVIREDTKTMVEIGALSPGDVPAALRKLWRI